MRTNRKNHGTTDRTVEPQKLRITRKEKASIPTKARETPCGTKTEVPW